MQPRLFVLVNVAFVQGLQIPSRVSPLVPVDPKQPDTESNQTCASTGISPSMCSRIENCSWIDGLEACVPICTNISNTNRCLGETLCRLEQEVLDPSTSFCQSELFVPPLPIPSRISRASLDGLISQDLIACVAATNKQNCDWLASKQVGLDCEFGTFPNVQKLVQLLNQTLTQLDVTQPTSGTSLCFDRRFRNPLTFVELTKLKIVAKHNSEINGPSPSHKHYTHITHAEFMNSFDIGIPFINCMHIISKISQRPL